MYTGLGQTQSAIPWGQAFASEESALASWISQHAGWVALGALVILAFATAGKGRGR